MDTEKKRKRILIVDDDKFLLDMYSLKFVEYDFDVMTALGSMEALEKLEKGDEPDIVLLDVVMPAMNGFEFLKKIQEEGLLSKSLVVILSNLSQEGDIKKGHELGVSGYIVKASATPTEVVKQVMKILDEHKK